MAGALSVTETGNVLNSFTAIEEHWEVEFSRFFNFPSPSSPSPVLRPLRRSVIRDVKGYFHFSITAFVLLMPITFAHLIGSVVGFEDLLGINFFFFQIQKFALRFVTSSEAERFINVLKKKLKEFIDIGNLQKNIKSDISSEVSSSSGFQCRKQESARDLYRAEDEIHVTPDVSYVSPALTYTPAPLPLDYKVAQTPCSQELVPAHKFETILPALPPSFTALLASCCTEAEKVQPKVPEQVDIMTQITKCMLDSSFNDVLNKVEKYISEMGGNLSI